MQIDRIFASFLFLRSQFLCRVFEKRLRNKRKQKKKERAGSHETAGVPREYSHLISSDKKVKYADFPAQLSSQWKQNKKLKKSKTDQKYFVLHEENIKEIRPFNIIISIKLKEL